MTAPSSLKQAPISCLGHSRPVVDICFSGSADCGPLFISAGKDGKAFLREGITGDWIGSFVGHLGAVWSCVLNANASRAATGAADFTAKLWDTATGSALLSITEGHIVRCVDLSKTDSSNRMATATNAKQLSVYDLTDTSTPVMRVANSHGKFIRRIAWCGDDRFILTASEDASMKLWSIADRDPNAVAITPSFTRQVNDPITDVQFRHPYLTGRNETTLAIACGSTIQVHTVDWRQPDALFNGQVQDVSLNLPCSLNSVSIHPTDNVVICAGEDHCIYRVDWTNGEILETCKGHFGPVHCVRFSPDGRLFVSGSEDGTVRLWQNEVGREFGLWKCAKPDQTEFTTVAVDQICSQAS